MKKTPCPVAGCRGFVQPHRPMCHACWHLVPKDLQNQVYGHWNEVKWFKAPDQRLAARKRFQESLDAAFQAAADKREQSPARPAHMNEWVSDDLVEIVARSFAAEGYKNAEEAYADGISRRYCEDFAYAALRALRDHGYRLIPPPSAKGMH